jgi:hypothetical protein
MELAITYLLLTTIYSLSIMAFMPAPVIKKLGTQKEYKDMDLKSEFSYFSPMIFSIFLGYIAAGIMIYFI